jgi:hypothetical protein
MLTTMATRLHNFHVTQTVLNDPNVEHPNESLKILDVTFF